MTRHVVSEADLEHALEQGRVCSARAFRASAVSYWPDHDAIAILTERHGGFLIPRALIEPLREVDIPALSRLELWPGGAAFEIADLDIHVSVHGLLTAALPAMIPSEVLSSLLGARGSRRRKPAPEAA
ncbi:hypothetical protein MKK63_20965 [Methylobacterium sp. J-088]|uniref:hypothetical protein n=1 Tax=Methylobacterium sp. J-088 TaxID=2836664 RepID=UPI001FB8E2A8|nr:hypothetical protein [Methylobacterium sp. J-088]MCJ2065165.1 hypothetical protein [Methylobacterium sp. J-088]